MSIIIKWAKNKLINIASAKIIQNKFIHLPKYKKKTSKKVCVSTINKILNKFISKPIKMWKVFVLSEKNKEKRYNFLKFLQKHNMSPDNIFFKDESVFNLSFINGNCKILITEKVRKNLKRGSQSTINLMVRPTQKKSLSIVFSGGIS